MERNSFIRRKSFWAFFTASVLTSFVWRFNSIADSIIVSHLVAPQALSAIGVISPVLSLLYVISSVLCSGSAILAANLIGKQKYTEASKILYICIISLALFYGGLSFLLMTFRNSITQFVTNDPALQALIEDYLPLTLLAMPITCINLATSYFVKIAGRPKLVMRSILAYCICNIILDILFTGVFHMGIRGAALATILSSCLAAICYLPYFKSRDCLYSRQVPDPSFFRKTLSETIFTGIPTGVSTICFSLVIFGLNTLVQKVAGSDGLFILTVGLQILSLCFLIIGGTGSAISTIGSVYLGEHDLDNYRNLVNDILKRSLLAMLVFSLILSMFPEYLAIGFGASGDMLLRVSGPLRMFTLILAPYSLMNLLPTSFIVLGHKRLSSNLSIITSAFMVGMAVIVCFNMPDQLWNSVPVIFAATLGIQILVTWLYSLRIKNINWFTLIPIYPNDPSISRSVPYSKEALPDVLNEMRLFVSICEFPQDYTDKIFHCIEELSVNIIDMANTSGTKGYFDIRAVHTPDKLLVVFKDSNRPYNPVFEYKADSGLSAEDEKLGLVILNAYCPDIKYSYMNGINCTYLNFPY